MLTAALVFGLLLQESQAVDAVTEAAAEESVIPAQPDSAVDEVTVYADDTLMNLRRKLRAVDELFYSRYNELNDNDDFDMVCKRETRLGSQIPRQVCRSKLHRARLSEAAEDVLDDDIQLGSDSVGWTRKHYREVRADVGRVLNADEQLRDIVRQRKRIVDEIDRRKADGND